MDQLPTFPEKLTVCVERLTQSGVSALSGLFDLTSQRLVRYATTITRNQHDAEDAVQATLVLVARNLRKFCRTDQPWPYLLRMVRNESLLIARRQKRLIFAGSLIDLSTHRSVDELETEENYRAVWSALRTLPTKQSEVVVLKIWEDMTFAQIAEVLEVPPDTAASRYRYAMAKLQQKLDPVDRPERANGTERTVPRA
ncbi:RNA polymerase sigma factor [Adhaeretor mobilis]|nr:sigma-70 family RNA polymerase sigma factor [Adhaeretor mobilis]